MGNLVFRGGKSDVLVIGRVGVRVGESRVGVVLFWG